jgi:hypothetical protein
MQVIIGAACRQRRVSAGTGFVGIVTFNVPGVFSV